MNKQPFVVASPKDDLIRVCVTPGHFATGSAHVSHYLDLGTLKKDAAIAMDVARTLAVTYLGNAVKVDTIVCMEGTEIIGAYLAQALLEEGISLMNSGAKIHVLTPTNNLNGQLMFLKGDYENIEGKQVILLVASVSSGKTVTRAIECLSYYGGTLVGVSALFTAERQVDGHDVIAPFTAADIPGYTIYNVKDCELCGQGKALDALITCHGRAEL